MLIPIRQLIAHLTCKEYVDNNIIWAIDNSSLLRLDANENLDIPNQDYITLNSALTSCHQL